MFISTQENKPKHKISFRACDFSLRFAANVDAFTVECGSWWDEKHSKSFDRKIMLYWCFRNSLSQNEIESSMNTKNAPEELKID